MFQVQGAKPGEAGMRPGVFSPVKNLDLYNQTKPCEVPPGCYAELGRSPPCELREGRNGRGIWTKPVLPNELIPRRGAVMMRPIPDVTALSTQYLGDHCSACHEERKKSQPLKRCQRCRAILYCDQTCQRFDWPLHKFECPALIAYAEHRAANPESKEDAEMSKDEIPVPSETIRALGRLLWLQFREKPGSGRRKEFELLQSHREGLAPSSPQTASYTRLGHALASYISLGAPSPEKLNALGIGSAKDIVDLLSKFSTNAHTLSSPSLTPIGVALSPIAALINHSCTPNCVVVFPKASMTKKVPNEMVVVALANINTGEELTTSYVDLTLPTEHRQKILNERYMFSCKCPLCKIASARSSSVVDGRRALRCGSRPCEGFLPMPDLDDPKLLKAEVKCLQCRQTSIVEPPAISDAIRIGEQGLEKAEALQLEDPDRAFTYTSNLLPLVSTFFHVGAHPVLSLARVHLSILITRLASDPSIIDQTVQAAARVAAGVSAIHTKGHPARGIAYAELGKLLTVDEYYREGQKPIEPTPSQLDPDANPVWHAGDDEGVPRGFERLRIAHYTLMQAREELMIGFGWINEGGAVGREVSELAKSIEREVAIWRRAGGGRRPGPNAVS
ncbi:hypothetical protein BDV93DRAFT_524686 [Ceratobasidium sp. AG-I]|nr:hypothetical protein BDV93DRAFT_524686 [Ceratobasidium sp. AG-I]